MSTFTIVLLFGFVLNAFLLLIGFILIDRQRRRHLARLLRTQAVAAGQRPAKMNGKKSIKADPANSVERIISFLEQQLEQSSLRFGAVEILIQASIALLGTYATAVLVLGVHPWAALPCAVLLVVGAVVGVVRIAQIRYRTAFIAELPEALDIFARGLRAGRPVADSMAIVVDNSKGAVEIEFRRCHDEVRMGTALAECLERLNTRLPLPEVSFFAVSTALQAETGGNLIETMENLANQLRARRQLRKKARALSSEARASAVILAALPFAVGLLIAVLNGGYLEPLYADARGRMMSLTAVTSICLGVFVMVRMGKLDV